MTRSPPGVATELAARGLSIAFPTVTGIDTTLVTPLAAVKTFRKYTPAEGALTTTVSREVPLLSGVSCFVAVLTSISAPSARYLTVTPDFGKPPKSTCTFTALSGAPCAGNAAVTVTLPESRPTVAGDEFVCAEAKEPPSINAQPKIKVISFIA